jgi:NADH:ubiquinone oxidoreductase subunit 6 (subunit J)
VLLVQRAGLNNPRALPEDFGTVRSVGRTFFGSFLFHFEYTSFLLLVGIVGAVVVSKRRAR